MVIETRRLNIRIPTTKDGDVNFYFRLWNDPKVMKNVGFLQGLMIRREDIIAQLAQAKPSEFDRTLIVIHKDKGIPIGECKLGYPNEKGIAQTDVKLLPEFWNRGLGFEIKQALVDYLFQHTTCKAVEATPNISNIASQKMQEKVGAKRVSEGVFSFPKHMHSYTKSVEYYLYKLDRYDWERERIKKNYQDEIKRNKY